MGEREKCKREIGTVPSSQHIVSNVFWASLHSPKGGFENYRIAVLYTQFLAERDFFMELPAM